MKPRIVESTLLLFSHQLWKTHEDTAIRCYVEYQQKRGVQVTVHKCGLHINLAIPWLAATPDSIVEINQEIRCLRVKCSFVYKTKQLAVATVCCHPRFNS